MKVGLTYEITVEEVMAHLPESTTTGWTDLNALRQIEREHAEHTLRFLAAKRDYPWLDHRGTEPQIVGLLSTQEIEREFNRK